MTVEKVYELLKDVIDPELHVNIVDLGLIYHVKVTSSGSPLIDILMTVTTPACPLAGSFNFMVRDALRPLGIDVEQEVRVNLTFDPPWTQDMMTDELKAQFGFDDWYQ